MSRSDPKKILAIVGFSTIPETHRRAGDPVEDHRGLGGDRCIALHDLVDMLDPDAGAGGQFCLGDVQFGESVTSVSPGGVT